MLAECDISDPEIIIPPPPPPNCFLHSVPAIKKLEQLREVTNDLTALQTRSTHWNDSWRTQ